MNFYWLRNIRSHLTPLLILLAATLSVYAQILGHEFQVNWDDSVYVMTNAGVRGFSWENVKGAFSGSFYGNYAPLHLISYMLDYELWGMWPGGYLLCNLLLHVVNGLLVYRLLFSLHAARLLAMVGAALFLLHPVQVETVAWISQRKNLLAMLFFLLAWEFYRRYRLAATGEGKTYYLISLVAFVLALLSKSVTVILPVALVLFDNCFPSSTRKARLRDMIPFVIAAAIVAFLALQSQAPVDSGWGAEGGGRAIDFHGGSPLATFFTMLPVFCRYLGMLVWPMGLSADYDPTIHTSPDSVVIASALALSVVGLLCCRLLRYDRRLGFWAIFFFLGLAPVSQIVPLITLMNDRYLYFPLLGFSALAGALVLFLRERLGSRCPLVLYVVIALMLMLCSVVSFQRAALWRSPVTLWNDAITVSPGKSLNWERLGEAYHFSHPMQPDEALKAYRKALEIDPNNRFTLYNIGLLYTSLGDYNNAHAVLTRLLDGSPEHVMGLTALGNLYRYTGRYNEAEKAYAHAYVLQPNALEVVVSLGELELIRGRLDSAKRYFMTVEGKRADDPEIAYDLACVEALSGRIDTALVWLEKSLQRGFNDHGRVYNNRELAALWSDPRYAELLNRFASQLR